MAKLTEAQRKQRAEYTRMRDIARKRILRAQAKGQLLDVEIPPTLKAIEQDYKRRQAAGDIVEKSIGRAIGREKTALSRFLQSESSTAAGRQNIERKRFEGYRKAGYNNITESNEQKFARFMKHMIKKYTEETPAGKRMLHDSDTIAAWFDDMVEEDRIHDKTRLSDLVRMFNKWVG